MNPLLSIATPWVSNQWIELGSRPSCDGTRSDVPLADDRVLLARLAAGVNEGA